MDRVRYLVINEVADMLALGYQEALLAAPVTTEYSLDTATLRMASNQGGWSVRILDPPPSKPPKVFAPGWGLEF